MNEHDDPEPRWWEWAAIFAVGLIAEALELAKRCWASVRRAD
jgi:hypothetical protein